MLERAMITLQLANTLRVVWACPYMGHTAETNERPEVFCDELRAIVADDSRPRIRVIFLRSLNNGFDVVLLHLRADIPVNDHSRVPIEDRNTEVERTANVEVRNVDMPMLMSLIGLGETAPILACLFAKTGQKAFRRKDPVDSAGTARDDIRIEHHVGQSPISIEWMFMIETNNRLLLAVCQPVVSRYLGIVLIRSPVTSRPIVEGTAVQFCPSEKILQCNFRFLGPSSNPIHNLVSNLMGNPALL
jgi:hypothetical protein